MSSRAGYALGGALLGVVPAVGALSNLFGCAQAIDDLTSLPPRGIGKENPYLGAGAAAASFVGIAANLVALDTLFRPELLIPQAVAPVILGGLAISAAAGALQAANHYEP